MDSSLTKEELRAYLSRWQKINARELKELRDSSMTQKIAQLNALILSVNQMGWIKSLGEEDAKVQNRWNRLRERHIMPKIGCLIYFSGIGFASGSGTFL